MTPNEIKVIITDALRDDEMKGIIKDAIREESNEIKNAITGLQCEMRSVNVRLETIEDRLTVLEQVTDRELWEFSREDVKRSQCDLKSIRDNLSNMINRIKNGGTDEVGASSAVSVCFMFCSMVEIGMQELICFANKTRPLPFTKSSKVAAASFIWPNGTRAASDSKFNFNLGIQNMSPELSRLLTDLGATVIPRKKDKGASVDEGLYYTLPSYMFSAARHVRNVGAHRSLRFVEGGTNVVPAGAAAQASKYIVWVPYNPMLSEYKTIDLGGHLFEGLARSATTLTTFNEVLIDKNGFISVDMVTFVDKVELTATVVCDKILAMLELFSTKK